MKKWIKSIVISVLLTLILAGGLFYAALPAINIKSMGFWIYVVILLVFFGLSNTFFGMFGNVSNVDVKNAKRISAGAIGIAALLFLLSMIVEFFSSPVFHAKAYANILTVNEDCDFETDLSETLSTDAIAIMDTDSARMLGNRKLGSLSSLVSQYNVSEEYSQINYQGTPVKVSCLEYAGFFRYMKNKSNGIPGYVLVSPVDMSAKYISLENNMYYVPSAHFSKKLDRHIRMHYPCAMIWEIWFEIDEEGKPYFVASVYDNKIGLFGGTDIVGAIIIDPVSGDMEYYKAEDVPSWVDIVYDGNLLCNQYDDYGCLRNGYLNSKFSAEGCKVTTNDFGYIAMDNDIWVYTGVTSVNSDASNIGFVLMNERTKEAKFYTIAGADEFSAMTAAEGEVQQYGYQASFPSLINIDGNATYIMVLKDSGGLVKMYAAVNAEQYNMVTTAADQKECIDKYRRMMKTGDVEQDSDTQTQENQRPVKEETIDPSLFVEKTVTVAQLKEIVVDGNTVLYLLTEDGEFYHAKYADVLDMMTVKKGDRITIEVYEELFLYNK